MKNDDRMLRKIKWGILILVVVSVCIFLTSFIQYQLRSREDKDISISNREAYLLLHHLIPFSEESQDWTLEVNLEGYMTYEDLEQYLQRASEQNQILQQQLQTPDSVILQSLQKLRDEYGEQREINRQDWYAFYDFLGSCVDAQYGTEEGIQVRELVLLKRVDSKHYVTSDGLMTLADEMSEIPLFQPVSVMTEGESILSCRQELEGATRISNVWLADKNQNSLHVYYAGEMCQIPVQEDALTDKALAEKERSILSQIADIEIAQGQIIKIYDKELLPRDKVLSVSEQEISLEKQGSFPLAENVKVYAIYGGVSKRNLSDVLIGYDYTDFVLEEGQITAALLIQNEGMDKIRVLIKGSEYASLLHEIAEFSLGADCEMEWHNTQNGEMIASENLEKGTSVIVVPGQQEGHADGGKIIVLQPGEEVYLTPVHHDGRIMFQNLVRSQGQPEYRGRIMCKATDEGLAVVNELLLEEYLYAVVPSEMPSSYPTEALKAQAVCARTYAYGKMQNALYPVYGAHIDDSTTCQVYQNIAEQPTTNEAVDATFGEILCNQEHQPVDVFYYATSCGFGTTEEIWGNGKTYPYIKAKPLEYKRNEQYMEASASEETFTVENMRRNEVVKEYLSTIDSKDLEWEEPWYRWSIAMKKIDMTAMSQRLQNLYRKHPEDVLTWEETAQQYEQKEIPDLLSLEDIQVVNRLPGGVADQLLLSANHYHFLICGEQNIRMILSQQGETIERQDGSEVDTTTLLPSGFIDVAFEDGAIRVLGGGFGHGVGMSQNGAAVMARNRMTEEEILTFFFQDVVIDHLYEK